MIVITHRPARTDRVELFTDMAEALARMFDLRLSGTSRLVMFDATVLSMGDGRHG